MTVSDSCGKKRRIRKAPKSRRCGKKGRRGKSRKGKGKGRKCARPGPVVRNAFINFLRDFRKKRCGKSMTVISKEAAKVWKCMSICKRSKYIKEACNASCGRKRKSHRRRKVHRKQRRKRRGGSRCGKKKRRPKKRKRVC